VYVSSMARNWWENGLMTSKNSWRDIRTLRGSLPENLRATVGLDVGRGREFHACLNQSQQLFEAAATMAYSSRPLALFYGLSQAGRAISAASLNLGTGQPNVLWNAVGHGLSMKDFPSSASQFLAAKVEVKPGKRDLFSRVSIAINSPVVATNVELGSLLAQIYDLAILFPDLLREFIPVIPAPRVSNSWPAYSGRDDVDLSIVGIDAQLDDVDLLSQLQRYPTLRTVRLAEGARPSPTSVRVHLGKQRLVPSYGAPTNMILPGASIYRRQEFVFPDYAQSGKSLQPLAVWWITLYACSMFARYAAASWTGQLDITSSYVASAIEHLLDVALDAVPEAILESLTSLNLDSDPANIPGANS